MMESSDGRENELSKHYVEGGNGMGVRVARQSSKAHGLGFYLRISISCFCRFAQRFILNIVF